MPTLLPRNSQAEAPSLLIAAISARSLVQSVRRASFAPLAADFFADTDTQALAHACVKLPGGMARGMRAQPLLRALDALAKRAPSPIAGMALRSMRVPVSASNRSERFRIAPIKASVENRRIVVFIGNLLNEGPEFASSPAREPLTRRIKPGCAYLRMRASPKRIPDSRDWRQRRRGERALPAT